MNDGRALAGSLRTAAAKLAALEPAIVEAGPWPLASRFDHSDEAAWGPREVLAHIDEMLPYWLGQVARILSAPPDAPSLFGRVATDTVRTGIIERDRLLPLDELFDRARSDAERGALRIERLSAADLARTGLHPTRGEVPVREALERFVVDHLAEHVRQLGDLIDTRPALPSA
jgi:hypothetical protein